ncbi:MAG: DNA-binding protein [Chlamydiia bacterium]|nr:DNA-binding protein [Chlamydiia bacterium]
MRYVEHSKGYVIKLEQGEDFQSSLGDFVHQKRLASSFFQGIGSLANVELGYFNLAKNEYDRHAFKGDYELISASGNISIEHDAPFVHTHVVLSDDQCKTIAGHLFKGIVTITAEVFLFPLDIALIRKHDQKLNFKGLDLPHHFVK